MPARTDPAKSLEKAIDHYRYAHGLEDPDSREFVVELDPDDAAALLERLRLADKIASWLGRCMGAEVIPSSSEFEEDGEVDTALDDWFGRDE
jgi:hypothetical protein